MQVDTNLTNLAEKVGSFIEYWGFKQVHGKVWTLIFLSPEPIDAKHLIQNLKISKALVSMTIKDLLFYNVIFEVEKDRPGTQKYKTNSDILKVICDILHQREEKMLVEIDQNVGALKRSVVNAPNPHVALDRIDALGEMVNAAQFLLKGMTSCDKVDFKQFEEAMNVNESSEA